MVERSMDHGGYRVFFDGDHFDVDSSCSKVEFGEHEGKLTATFHKSLGNQVTETTSGLATITEAYFSQSFKPTSFHRVTHPDYVLEDDIGGQLEIQVQLKDNKRATLYVERLDPIYAFGESNGVDLFDKAPDAEKLASSSREDLARNPLYPTAVSQLVGKKVLAFYSTETTDEFTGKHEEFKVLHALGVPLSNQTKGTVSAD